MILCNFKNACLNWIWKFMPRDCHRNIGPGKFGPAGPILDTKTGPAGPNLVDQV